MTGIPDPDRALVFGRAADDYDRWRPGYPDDAVDWLAPTAPARVLEIGAGTGQLTRSLVARGLTVEVVEPDEDMLAVLSRRLPEVSAHVGVADSLPVPDDSVDAVLVASAWHWFPFEHTTGEVRRVLRPGGWLGLVWNEVTPLEPWELEAAGLDPDLKGLSASEVDDVTGGFPPDETEVAIFPWTLELTPEHYAAYLATNSAVILMSESERTATRDEARALAQRLCAELERDTLGFHHAATCLRWTPR